MLRVGAMSERRLHLAEMDPADRRRSAEIDELVVIEAQALVLAAEARQRREELERQVPID